jgi:hypothetical protein
MLNVYIQPWKLKKIMILTVLATTTRSDFS